MRKRSNYRPRPVRLPSIVGSASLLAAPMKMLHDIRHSLVMEVNRGVVMPTLDDYELHDAPTALEIYAEVLTQLPGGQNLDVSPVKRLANRLRHDMPIDDAALAPVEALFDVGQRLANRVSPDRAIEIIRGV